MSNCYSSVAKKCRLARKTQVSSHDQRKFDLYKGDMMDCLRWVCCCSSGVYTKRMESESSPLVKEDSYPSIDMTGVGIQVSKGDYPRLLADLDIHEVSISYHPTQGWLLVEGSGRNQAAHKLKEDAQQSNNEVVAYSMTYSKDGSAHTITVKIPIGTCNLTTSHSQTDASLN